MFRYVITKTALSMLLASVGAVTLKVSVSVARATWANPGVMSWLDCFWAVVVTITAMAWAFAAFVMCASAGVKLGQAINRLTGLTKAEVPYPHNPTCPECHCTLLPSRNPKLYGPWFCDCCISYPQEADIDWSSRR